MYGGFSKNQIFVAIEYSESGVCIAIYRDYGLLPEQLCSLC